MLSSIYYYSTFETKMAHELVKDKFTIFLEDVEYVSRDSYCKHLHVESSNSFYHADFRFSLVADPFFIQIILRSHYP